MIVQNKGMNYRIQLSENENVKILINDIEVFDESVSMGKEVKVKFDYQENLISEE